MAEDTTSGGVIEGQEGSVDGSDGCRSEGDTGVGRGRVKNQAWESRLAGMGVMVEGDTLAEFWVRRLIEPGGGQVRAGLVGSGRLISYCTAVCLNHYNMYRRLQ